MPDALKIIECPRDAWQGLREIIPAQAKAAYLATLVECGFRHIDAVSFVSPKHVPQMADSEQVLRQLQATTRAAGVEIIGIVVNEQGFRRALDAGVTTIGYPYSLSERFTHQNANMTQAQSRALVETMANTLAARPDGPGLVIYISMGFGNPYGEPWNPAITADAVHWLQGVGVRQISLADTVGLASAADVVEVLRCLDAVADGPEIGLHLHSRRESAAEKILAAYDAGCRRFDSALTGLGGCPFAGDELVGNIPTEIVVETLARRGADTGICPEGLAAALAATRKLRARFAP